MPATLDAGRAAIQSGEAFKPPPAVDDFDEFGEALGSKGGGLSSLSASVKSAWGAATRNLGTYLSVAESQTKVIELEAKSKGREPTEEELDEACGPLSFLTKIPNILGDALSDIFGKFNEFATAFGETVGEFMGKLDSLIADVANAIDEVAQAAAQVLLDAFEAANAVALQAIEAIESVVNTVTTAINDAIQFATDAFNSAVDKLLAFADGLNFASLFSLDCQKEALEEAVDTEKIADQAEVQRVTAPTVVNGTDNTKTSESLSNPQTKFESTAERTPPPDLDTLLTKYRTAARALRDARQRTSPALRRAEEAGLEIAEIDSLQEVRVAWLASGRNLDDLPVYGTNFDQPLRKAAESRGADAAKPNAGVGSESKDQRLQREIAEIKRDIALYNKLNREQFQAKQNQKFSWKNIAGKVTYEEYQAVEQKRRDADSLRSTINTRIVSRPLDEFKIIDKAVGKLDGVFR